MRNSYPVLYAMNNLLRVLLTHVTEYVRGGASWASYLSKGIACKRYILGTIR